jgi:hypothetical protein
VADINFTLTADDDVDDLPRTLRREREARQREAREREEKARAATLTHDFGASETQRDIPAFAAAPAAVGFTTGSLTVSVAPPLFGSNRTSPA